ncbi:MAG: beta-lactamase family protein [Sphingomonadales bacterium]|nr:beta-lactamase family protein [Sphingomonadales bacterium]MDE2170790.1 beta-lactamase family protein [Sphingomonadales bacterium]
MTWKTRRLARLLALLAAMWGPPQVSADPVPVIRSLPPMAGAVHALSRQDLESWLDGLMPYALHQADVAGAVVVVVKDGRVLLEKGYGYADVAGRRPVDPERTLFRPGSISKLFTFTAVMQLVESGKIGLDTDINAYLDFRIPSFGGQPVTMRNLMTHTPGFEDSLRDLYADPTRPPPDLARFVRQQVPARIYPPGKVTAYSNYGVTLAGYIVQRVSGQRFDDYVDQHILRPLGMRNATFRQPLPPRLRAQMANGYGLASEPARPTEIIGVAPAGALAASGDDMAKFMIAHLQDGTYQGARILDAKTARTMHDTPATIVSPATYRFLLGFYERNRNGHRIIAHDGDSQWFHSNLLLYLDDGVGLFVSMNSRGQGGGSSLIREALYQGFTDRYFPGPGAGTPAEIASARQDARAIAGDYLPSRREDTTFWSLRNLMNQVSVIDEGNGHLVVPQITGLDGQPEHFAEVAPFVWQEIGGTNRLAARVEAGRVVMWTDNQDANGNVFQPTPLACSRWILPLLQITGAILLLAGLVWPPLIAGRWRPASVSARFPAWAGIVAPLCALASGSLLAAWYYLVTGLAAVRNWTSAMVPLVTSLHMLGLVVFPASLALAAWHVRMAWSGRSEHYGMLRLTASLVLLACTSIALWGAMTFHLMAARTAF